MVKLEPEEVVRIEVEQSSQTLSLESTLKFNATREIATCPKVTSEIWEIIASQIRCTCPARTGPLIGDETE